MSKTYRAAILCTADRQGSIVLTLPEHAALSDEELLAEAQREIDRANIREQMAEDDVIKIGDWTA